MLCGAIIRISLFKIRQYGTKYRYFMENYIFLMLNKLSLRKLLMIYTF